MSRTELIIQLLKVAIGLAFGAYFVWWSLQVLDRLTPEVDGPTAMVGRIFNSNASLVGASWENEADCGIDMARCDVLKLRDFCVSSVLHEIKHDGFRIIARKDGAEVKLYSRPGNDFTRRFPLIIEALARLRSQSCIIDGEAVACGDNGVASFDRIRYRRHDGDVFLYAFDLIELNGDDMRRDPLEVRKTTLRSVLAKAGPGLRFNEHLEGDGATVFAHACKMALEGIVSKRKDSPYRSGHSPHWLKMKNAEAPAVKREAEEDWGKERWR